MTYAACRCAHAHDLHVHYRPGTDCALCSCGRYRPARRSWSLPLAARAAAQFVVLGLTGIGIAALAGAAAANAVLAVHDRKRVA